MNGHEIFQIIHGHENYVMGCNDYFLKGEVAPGRRQFGKLGMVDWSWKLAKHFKIFD